MWGRRREGVSLERRKGLVCSLLFVFHGKTKSKRASKYNYVKNFPSKMMVSHGISVPSILHLEKKYNNVNVKIELPLVRG
jgi:hypothetical protein